MQIEKETTTVYLRALPTVERRSTAARWALRVALFTIQLVLIGLIFHRVGAMSTPLALSIFATSFALATLVILLGVWALVKIWQRGDKGASKAVFAMFLAGLVLGWPALTLPAFLNLPNIHDISTDTGNPPAFVFLSANREPDANSPAYGGPEVAKLQSEAYPDIAPLVVKRPAKEAFEIARHVIKLKGWDIVTKQPPLPGRPTGMIEATEHTLIMGFPDDIVVRIRGAGGLSRIDVRSASRYGSHDLGRNASRVRDLLKILRARTVVGDVPRDVDEDKSKPRKSKSATPGLVGSRWRPRRVTPRVRRGRATKVRRRASRRRRSRSTPFPSSDR